MQPQPLILAPHWDVHAAAVCWGLEINGIKPLWIPSLAEDAVGPVSLYGSDQAHWQLQAGKADMHWPAVWYWRPRKPRVFPSARTCDTRYLRLEWSFFHDNVYALGGEISNALWINRPESAFSADNKLVQLSAARQCGLCFPETLVSNDPAAIKRFIKQHRHVVHKGFFRFTWENAETGELYTQWVNILNPDTDLDEQSLLLNPGIYQPYIKKQSDIRVTVIGNRMFAVRINSLSGDGFDDWRRHAVTEEIQAVAINLPYRIERKLRKFMRKLNLVYGCIDLIESQQGEIYFLEVNQNGQFLFVEVLVGSLPVFQAMCSLIATGKLDYDLQAAKKISYPDYLKTESFEKWLEQNEEKINIDQHNTTTILE